MTQRIYDSRAQAVVNLEPREAGKIGMYVCGPTVQSAPHIGHLRSALVYDQIRRWLVASGLQVTLIRNVTDIDDKILERAAASAASGRDEAWWALAYRVEREFSAAYDAIGVAAPTYEPRATANVQGMIEVIERLIARGHAYTANDGSANVFFDTRSWEAYGALTRQSRESMDPAADSAPIGKRDPRDFALWKAHRDTEPESAAWDSPWGRGRPGWHIECSAMAARYLGSAFDIHGGGLDLRFPHHENELAQSTAAGDEFAKYWIHNGIVNVGGQKMSKSLGNSLFAADLLREHRPIVLRYFLGSAHYRSVMEVTPSSLSDAATAFGRIETFVQRAVAELGEAVRGPGDLLTVAADDEHLPTISDRVPAAFREAMNDDFGMPQALACVHETVRAGNAALDSRSSTEAAEATHEAASLANQLVDMLAVLGLDPRHTQWQHGDTDDRSKHEHDALDALVNGLLQEREVARAERNFARSDQLRDQLAAVGIEIEDTRDGARWSVT